MYSYFPGKITSYATSYCPRKDARRTIAKFQSEATIAVRGRVETGAGFCRGVLRDGLGNASASFLTKTTINIKFILQNSPTTQQNKTHHRPKRKLTIANTKGDCYVKKPKTGCRCLPLQVCGTNYLGPTRFWATHINWRPFPLLICLERYQFVLLSVFTLVETICPQIWAKPLPKNAKRLLPGDERRSKTSLLKLFNCFLTSFRF